MWTTENRSRYNRDGLRYPSDLSDAEWCHIAGLIPPGKRGGGKRRVDLREVMNGISISFHPAHLRRRRLSRRARRLGGLPERRLDHRDCQAQ